MEAYNSLCYACSDESAFLMDPTFQEDIQNEFLDQEEATQGKVVATVMSTLKTSMKALRDNLDTLDKEQVELRGVHDNFRYILDILYEAVKKEGQAWKMKDVMRYIRPVRGGEISVRINEPEILKVEDPKTTFLKELRSLTLRLFVKIHDDLKELDDQSRAMQTKLKNYIKFSNALKSISGESVECPICQDRKLAVFYAPCGHTVCSECNPHSVTCYLCRTPIESRKKLYIG